MIRSILYLMLGCILLAQSTQAATMSEELQARYRAIKTFTATFEQILVHKESGMRETRTGKLSFSRPFLIRWETAVDSNSAELLVVSDKEIWNYLPEEAVAYRMPLVLVQDSRSIIQVITGQARLDKDFDVKEQGTDKGLTRLRLYPKEPSPQMVEASLWIDPVTKFMQRVVITDFYGNTNDITMKEFQPDVAIPHTAFQFSPPKGVEVEDRMDPNVQERELFN